MRVAPFLRELLRGRTTRLLFQSPSPGQLLSDNLPPLLTRMVGSLCSAFASAWHVRLTVKLACAITLSARFPFAPSQPLDSSVTFQEDSAPLKLPARYCFSPFLPSRLENTIQKSGISLTTPPRPRSGLQSLPPMLRIVIVFSISSCSKAPGVFSSNCRKPASSPVLYFHRAGPRDSSPVITPFVRVQTYWTRNFATLGPFISDSETRAMRVIMSFNYLPISSFTC